MRPTLEDLAAACSPSVRKANAAVLGTVIPSVPQPTKPPADYTEADMQADCERWLVLSKGYGRRTPKTMQKHHTGKWFVHLNVAKGNPVLLDLLLLRHYQDEPHGHGDYLEIELKTATGRVNPDQGSLIMRGDGVCVRSEAEFRAAVERWEGDCESRRRMGLWAAASKKGVAG